MWIDPLGLAAEGPFAGFKRAALMVGGYAWQAVRTATHDPLIAPWLGPFGWTAWFVVPAPDDSFISDATLGERMNPLNQIYAGFTAAANEPDPFKAGAHTFNGARGTGAIVELLTGVPGLSKGLAAWGARLGAGFFKSVLPLADDAARGALSLADEASGALSVADDAAKGALSVADDGAKGAAKVCSGPGCICFTAGTPVLMADGSKKSIEEVQAGDDVLVDDPTDARPPEAGVVLESLVTQASTIYSIRVEGADEAIESTSRHPFWTQRGWVAAEELERSDVLMDSDGNAVVIKSLVAESRDEVTYNLTVDKHHTFFVAAGEVEVLVHNVDPWDILFTQNNYGSTFAEGPWKGRTVEEAIAAARRLGRLPDGLTLSAVRNPADGTWATLNNRTLAVARGANLSNVDPVDVGAKGFGKLQQLLKNSGLSGPVEDAVMRCK